VLNLVDYGRIRIAADRIGVESIDRQGSIVVFTFKGQGGPEPLRVLRLVNDHPEVTLAPPSSLKLDLAWTPGKTRPWQAAPRPGPALGADALKGQPWRAEARKGQALGAEARKGQALGAEARKGEGGSWWTARATEGQVRPGFSKEAILRPEKEDPRGASGVLTRVRNVLSALV